MAELELHGGGKALKDDHVVDLGASLTGKLELDSVVNTSDDLGLVAVDLHELESSTLSLPELEIA